MRLAVLIPIHRPSQMNPRGIHHRVGVACLFLACWSLGCGDPSTTKQLPAATTEIAASVEEAASTTEPATNPAELINEDWPEFLGPRRDGTSAENGLLKSWPAKGPKLLWEKPVGTGYSAPSIRNGKLVVHHRQRREDRVECVNAETGEPVWTFEYSTDFSDPYGYNNGPRASPLLTENRCFTYGAQGKLLCLNLATGEKLWERDTQSDWDVPDHFFGAGCSPILEGNLLIVAVGGQPNSGVIAFDPETGKSVWESVGKQTWDNAVTSEGRKAPYKWTGKEMVVSYSPPIAATIHGQRHLLCFMRQGLVSLDPATGEERFKYWFRAKVHESVNAARPVVIDDQIFLSAAYDVGAVLLKVAEDGKSVSEVWRDADGLSTHWSTTIHHDGFLYGFSGRHEQEARFQCVELKTGKLVWETTGYTGKVEDLAYDGDAKEVRNTRTNQVIPWPFYGRGSKILVENRFIVLGEHGTLALVEVDSKRFREISRAAFPQMKYPSWAAPVLSHGRLYLRSETHLVCLDLRTR